MADLEEVSIDDRDVDYTWFEGVKAYLDCGFDQYHFPRESMERLGELDTDTGDSWLIDGHDEAKANQIEVEGQNIPLLVDRLRSTDRQAGEPAGSSRRLGRIARLTLTPTAAHTPPAFRTAGTCPAAG